MPPFSQKGQLFFLIHICATKKKLNCNVMFMVDHGNFKDHFQVHNYILLKSIYFLSNIEIPLKKRNEVKVFCYMIYRE